MDNLVFETKAIKFNSQLLRPGTVIKVIPRNEKEEDHIGTIVKNDGFSLIYIIYYLNNKPITYTVKAIDYGKQYDIKIATFE